MTEPEIFAEALQLSDPIEQSAYLARICGENRELQQRIMRLLEFSQTASSLLDRPPAEHLENEPKAMGIALLQPFLAPAERPDSAGRLGHYEILEFLGQGGFGIVVKAFDTRLHRVVAIKALAPNLATTSPPRKRFLREAWAAAQVQHPNVVQIFAVEEQPLPYLVMEYVEGRTLQQRLDDIGPLDTDEVLRIGRQVALGLAAAHEKGLVHRDVKPANIMLQSTPQAEVKLTDFGIARAGDEASLTQSGLLAGTPLFMSPEQAQGEALDHRADLFSLGSVLYTLTCGHPPFRAPTAFAVLKRVAEDRPRPLAQLVPEIPSRLNDIICKLLQKKPALRYQTAHAVAADLAEANPDRESSMFGTAAAAAVVLLATILGGGWWMRDLLSGSPESTAAVVPGNEFKPSEAASPPEAAPVVETKPEPAASLDRDPWSLAVAAMAPEEQVSEVVARLKELNPELQAEFSHAIEDDAVKRFRVNHCNGLNDLSPLRALSRLEDLRLSGGGAADLRPLRGLKLKHLETNGSPIEDLSPLRGMPLHTLLLWAFRTGDLSPLAGMQLERVNLGASPVKDISVLRDMPLQYLCLNYSQVEDLAPLQGAPLKVLECENTSVVSIQPLADSRLERCFLKGSPIADLSPLKTLKLKRLSLNDPQNHVQLLREIPTLDEVNGKPVADVLGGVP